MKLIIGIFIVLPLNMIFNFNIVNKNNGILIQLNSKSKFSIQDIATSQSNAGWFNVTILNCELDSIQLKEIHFNIQ